MTEQELKDQGLVKENDTTWGDPKSDRKVDVIKTDNGDYLGKERGRDDVYKK